jgi:cell division protein FtsB
MAFLKPNRGRLAIGIVVVITLFVVGGLALGFGQQMMLAREMRTEEARLEQAVATEQTRHDELTTLSEHVGSDEYVEQWAREEAKMSKPGEVVVIPVATGEGPTPEAQPEETPTPEPRPFWVEWWELLFSPSVAE